MLNSTKCYKNNSICEEFKDYNCVQFLQDSVVVIEENRRKIIFKNKNKECLARVKIDGGLINTSDEKKTDYMLIRCDHDIVYLIELKGGHADEAYKQILNTIKLIKGKIKNATINARIITSKTKTPNIITTEKRRLMEICKQNGGCVIVRTREYTEDL